MFHDGEDGLRLIGAKCVPCGGRAFPFADTCPWCGADGTHETSLAPTGSLWGWTAVTASPPGYDGEVPFGFGVVELDEGPRVITRLTEADPGALTFGQRVHLVTDVVARDDDGNDVITWAFAPDET